MATTGVSMISVSEGPAALTGTSDLLTGTEKSTSLKVTNGMDEGVVFFILTMSPVPGQPQVYCRNFKV
jgi:hypothetical protein